MPPAKPLIITSGLLGCMLFTLACNSPVSTIAPVMYADPDQSAFAMRSAPVVLVVKITDAQLISGERTVPKPPEVAGPRTPTIPLFLARIQADVLLTLRGSASNRVEFYRWVWASGMHGGPRLFHSNPGSNHVIFLRPEGHYLHTVGDYPSYDLELSSEWISSLRVLWNSQQKSGADPIERLIALRLRAEFDGLSDSQLQKALDGAPPHDYYLRGLGDLVRLIGPLFVANQLDDVCRYSAKPSMRIAACLVTAEYFPGRCQAYGIASKAMAEDAGSSVAKRLVGCETEADGLISDIRSDSSPCCRFYGWSVASEHRRETMRVYASAMDERVHVAACEVAARTAETHDIPECLVR